MRLAATLALGLAGAAGMLVGSPTSAEATASIQAHATPVQAAVNEGSVATFTVNVTQGLFSIPAGASGDLHYSTPWSGNGDFTPIMGTFHYDSAHTSFTVTVPTTDDTVLEDNEPLQLTAWTDSITTGSVASALVLDNDPTGFTVISDGSYGRFRVLRSGPISTAVTVDLGFTSGQNTVSQALTFQPDGAASQSVQAPFGCWYGGHWAGTGDHQVTAKLSSRRLVFAKPPFYRSTSRIVGATAESDFLCL